jgi:hypothetical protein
MMLHLAVECSQFRVYLTFTRSWLLHPFIRRSQTHRRQDENRLDVLPCLILTCLAARPGESGKILLASLCNRSTTRAPTDRSIPERLACAELTADRIDTCSERPCGVPPSCEGRTPGGHVFDGTSPTLAKSRTTLPNGKGRAPHRAMPPRRSVFNRVRGCSIWPLTLPVPPR